MNRVLMQIYTCTHIRNTLACSKSGLNSEVTKVGSFICVFYESCLQQLGDKFRNRIFTSLFPGCTLPSETFSLIYFEPKLRNLNHLELSPESGFGHNIFGLIVFNRHCSPLPSTEHVHHKSMVDHISVFL